MATQKHAENRHVREGGEVVAMLCAMKRCPLWYQGAVLGDDSVGFRVDRWRISVSRRVMLRRDREIGKAVPLKVIEPLLILPKGFSPSI